jgi:hypothetical protein
VSTYRILLTAISVQSAKASYHYGPLAKDPVDSGAAYILLRAGVSLPKTAVVTAAKIWINQAEAFAGSNTLSIRRNYTAIPKSVTWNTKPAVTDVTHTQAKSGIAYGEWWDIDVTSDVQGYVAGTKVNYGWRLFPSSGTVMKLLGSAATVRQPYLEITYVIPPKVPTNLSPAGGSVATDLPVLTFTTGSDTLSVQVQVDPAADSVTPDFDSGEYPATAGVVDLAATDMPGGLYPGLADGSTTYWRARAKNSYGWSGWSAWVSFSRNDLDAVTLLSPTDPDADGTPPFLWSFAGTQTAWQATLMDADGKTLDDSGAQAGTDTGWTPAKGLTANGDQGIARVRVWDDVTRIATPGVPAYSEALLNFTVAFDGAVDPMDTLAAAQVGGSPGIALTGTRAAGIPDEVAVFRNGVQVARFPGTDIFTTATDFAWTDWSAPLNTEATYRLAPVVGGAVASGGPTATITPTSSGLWLVDVDTDVAAVLWGAEEGSYDASDVATVHVVVSKDAPVPVVRRRLRRGVISGTESGVIIDVDGFPASDTLTALQETFPANDAGTIYRLIDGHLNIAVIAGDFLVSPTPESDANRFLAKAQFSFWSI